MDLREGEIGSIATGPSLGRFFKLRVTQNDGALVFWSPLADFSENVVETRFESLGAVGQFLEAQAQAIEWHGPVPRPASLGWRLRWFDRDTDALVGEIAIDPSHIEEVDEAVRRWMGEQLTEYTWYAEHEIDDSRAVDLTPYAQTSIDVDCYAYFLGGAELLG